MGRPVFNQFSVKGARGKRSHGSNGVCFRASKRGGGIRTARKTGKNGGFMADAANAGMSECACQVRRLKSLCYRGLGAREE